MTLEEYCALTEARFTKSGYWRAKAGLDVRPLTHAEAQIAARASDGTCHTCGAMVPSRHLYCAACMAERRREQSSRHKASVHNCKCGKQAMPSSSRCKDCNREYKRKRKGGA